MDAFVRTTAVYLFLLAILRLAGKRTLSQMSTFDFILLLIVSEATQNALIDDDRSLSNGLAVILTLVSLDRIAAYIKMKSSAIERFLEGAPLLLVEDGKVLEERLDRSRVTLDDILQSARQTHGLGRLDQIRYAVLEATGGISIIPADRSQELEQRIEAAVARALQQHGRASS